MKLLEVIASDASEPDTAKSNSNLIHTLSK